MSFAEANSSPATLRYSAGSACRAPQPLPVDGFGADLLPSSGHSGHRRFRRAAMFSDWPERTAGQELPASIFRRPGKLGGKVAGRSRSSNARTSHSFFRTNSLTAVQTGLAISLAR